MIKRLSILVLSLTVLSSSSATLYYPRTASAANVANWQAGRIIDDEIFTDSRSMSVSQIQDFLNQKVGTGGYDSIPGQCDNNGARNARPLNYSMTRAQYAQSVGKSSTFTCLNGYYEVPKTSPGPGIPANNYGGGAIPQGAISSAQMIWNAAQRYNISPKVLLVTIQKESAGPLTTDDWPWHSQFTYAMGAHCPDGPGGAQCDPNYAGFSIQIAESAALFRYYLDNMTQSWWSYKKPYQNNTVYFNPGPCQTRDSNGTCTKFYGNKYDSSGRSLPDITYCGSTSIYIQSRATAALYTYTPYQPNQSALDNLYGSGDYCGAYGNRNFWRIYSDWFGTTTLDKPTTNVGWKFENLAGGTDGISPTTNTVGIQPKAITYRGNLYVFYYDATQKLLKLSYADTTGWHDETVDGNSTVGGRIVGDVGQATSALVYNDTLHIYYYDATNRALRHASYNPDAGGWQFESLDGTAGSISARVANVGMSNTSVTFAGGMHIFYYDQTNTNLRHGWFYPATGWKFENLDGDFGSIAGLNSNLGQNPDSLVFGDTLQLFYYDVNNGNLRHAWASATQPWKFENLDGDVGSVGHNNNNTGSMSRAISYNGVLYVVYRENSGGLMRYAWADSGGWHFAPLDGSSFSVTGNTSNTGFSPTITTFGNSLQLFYFDNDRRALRHAFGTPYY